MCPILTDAFLFVFLSYFGFVCMILAHNIPFACLRFNLTPGALWEFFDVYLFCFEGFPEDRDTLQSTKRVVCTPLCLHYWRG